MNTKKKNPERVGKKINDSHLVYQTVKLIYEGVPDTHIQKILEERYGFRVSSPSIVAFRDNFYAARLKEMRSFSRDLQERQTGRIKSFIDESLAQASDVKTAIDAYLRQVRAVESKIDWVRKFEFLFETSIDEYVRKWKPGNPPYLDSESSEEEKHLKAAVNSMGDAGISALSAYAAHRNAKEYAKLLAFLMGKLLQHRQALVSIHRDVFKAYRNFSILQELSLVFERYNSLIIEEFFPNKETMDKAKYARVRKRILAMFDEFQIRYQSVESPSKENPEEVQTFEEVTGQYGLDSAKAVHEKQSGKEDPPEDITEEEARSIQKDVETPDTDLFSTGLAKNDIMRDGNDVVADLQSTEGTPEIEK